MMAASISVGRYREVSTCELPTALTVLVDSAIAAAVTIKARGESLKRQARNGRSIRSLVFLFDGTWFGPYQEHASHVLRLAGLLRRTNDDGRAQIVFYYPGVGTGSGTGRLAKFIDKWTGGAFGAGYQNVISEAYLDLVLNYQPGDSVFLFGWSRGAFMTRQLVNLIRNIGLSDKEEFSELPKLTDDILTRRNAGLQYHPDGDFYIKLRASISSRVSIGTQRDLEFRRENGLITEHVFSVSYVGLWDCVSAIGPSRRFAYHDNSLTLMVERSRHAVSADERRSVFLPDLWDNLEELNSRAACKLHEQAVFPGDHVVVGGGLPSSFGLSMANFVWVIEGAAQAGLAIDQTELQSLRSQIDLAQPLSGNPTGLTHFLSSSRRYRNLDGLELSEAFQGRQRIDPAYWPER